MSWDVSGKAKIGGDSSIGDMNKTTTNTYGGTGITAHEVWMEFVQFQRQCETDKKDMRAEFDKRLDRADEKLSKVEERFEDMKRGLLGSGLVAGLVIVVGLLFFFDSSPNNGNQSVTAVSESQWIDIVQKGYDTIPSVSIDPRPQQGQHCIYRATDNREEKNGGLTKEDCFDTVELAVAELAGRTGENYNELLIAREDAGVSTAVIGVHYACSHFACGSVTVYAGNGGGCYGGQRWYQPVINYTVNSALTLGGCYQTTFWSQLYMTGWSLPCVNCSTIGGVVKSADYK